MAIAVANLDQIREQIVEYGAELYDRHLTDVSGGNISVRAGDVLLMTPTLAGGTFHWRLQPEQVLVLDLEGHKLEGEGEISREVRVHVALLNEFYPEGTAVIHGHSRHVLVFCAADQPMPPVLNNTAKFGTIPQCADAPAGTQALADNIAAAIRRQRERIARGAAAVMAPRHGLFVIGRDLATAFDAVDRIDTNAFCILMGRGLLEPEAWARRLRNDNE